MNKIDEMIDAVGLVTPPHSLFSKISVKESDCYSLVYSAVQTESYKKDPVSVVFESIMWGSRMMKSHPLYWVDKRKLMTRILRSANTALFTRYKEHIQKNAVDAMVGFRGNIQLWLAAVGQVMIWNYHDSHIELVYPIKEDERKEPLGSHRYGFAPFIVPIYFKKNGFTFVSAGSMSLQLQNIATAVFDTPEEIFLELKNNDSHGAWIAIPH